MTLVIVIGAPGSDWNTIVAPAWTSSNSVNGASGVVAYTSPAAPTRQGLLTVVATLDDDLTVPPVIVMTNVRIQFGWTVVCAAATELTDSNNVESIPAGGSGNFDGNSDPITYFGGVTRADLFGGIVLWEFASVAMSLSQSVTVSDFTVTVTYVTPASVTLVSPSFGSVAGGQAVTITGTGFGAATGVTFGGVAATSVVIVDATTITAVTPGHTSGLVDVEVLSVATGANLYTYVIPAPRLPPIPTRTPIMQGGPRRGR